MNQERMDYLTTYERGRISADVRDLLDDADLSVAITYKRFVSRVLTPSTGQYTTTYTNLGIRAIRNELSAKEVVAGAGQYQMGDVHYMIAVADQSQAPSREDRIVEGSDTFEVRAWYADPLKAVWDVVARKVA